jgi:hypothetical protein
LEINGTEWIRRGYNVVRSCDKDPVRALEETEKVLVRVPVMGVVEDDDTFWNLTNLFNDPIPLQVELRGTHVVNRDVRIACFETCVDVTENGRFSRSRRAVQ